MINGSFEQPWTTFPTGNQEPAHWTLATYAVGSTLRAPKAGNGDTETKALCVPECVHKLDWQLPAEEQLGGPKALILEGKAVYKIFGKSAFRATLAQQWTVTPGAVCSLTIPVQVHGGLKPDGTPYNVDRGAAYWRVTINGTPGPWFTFIDDFDDRVWMWYSPGFKALYGTVDLLIEFESHTLAPVDFFIDNVQFNSEQPQPPQTECPKPRPGWESRTTVLVHFDAPHSAFIEAAEWADEDYRRHDVARAWDPGLWSPGLREVNIKCWQDIPDRFPPGLVEDWAKEYYPSINANITNVIAYDQGGDPPPQGNVPQPIVHYSGNFVGLHHCFLKQDWDKYITTARPSVTKFFACGDMLAGRALQPQMLNVWRKHVDKDGEWLIGDIRANAKKFFYLYHNELELHCWKNNLTEAQVLDGPVKIVMESINETVPSNNAQHINRAVEFDVNFSEFLHAEYGDNVHAGLMTVAVGNPLEEEVPLLLPCAKLSHERGDFLSYHGYWAADRGNSYLDDGYPWHAGRWEEWDIEFNKHGYYPRYYLGESGICATYPESHGTNFISTRGWKTCGDFPNYIKQIEEFNELLQIWNEWHQGRCYGITLFTYGAWGWDDFDFNPGDLALLREAMKVYA